MRKKLSYFSRFKLFLVSGVKIYQSYNSHFFRSNCGQSTTHKRREEREEALEFLEHPDKSVKTSILTKQTADNQVKTRPEHNRRARRCTSYGKR